MKHGIFGIIILCLVLAGNVLSGQEMITTPDGRVHAKFTVSDGQTFTICEEELNRILVEEGITVEELQRQFRSVVIDDSVNFQKPQYHLIDPAVDEEELQRQVEQQRKEEELFQAMFADVGVTEAEIEQFSINMAGVVEPYEKFIDDNPWLDHPTRENYVETAELFFNNFVQPVMNDVRSEAINFFTEDQYAKMTTRLYQIAETISNPFQENENDLVAVLAGGLVQTILLPEVVSLTKEQLSELSAMQKEIFIDLVVTGLNAIDDISAEHDALDKEMENAKTEEEKAVINEKLNKISQQISALMQEPIQKATAKIRVKLDTLPTAEQKAKLTQIKEDIPDYLRKILANVIPTDEGETSAVTGAWLPVINSWVPGMGAPGVNPNREAPQERTNTGGRAFPGGE